MAETPQLVIVRRNQFPKFALLAQAFADEPHVRLIWDRRLCDQRRKRASSSPEDRRCRDRRCDASKTWVHNDLLLLGVAERVESGTPQTEAIAIPNANADEYAPVNKEVRLDIEAAASTVEGCFASAGLARTTVDCRRGEVIFSEGDAADSIMYVLTGIVKLSVSGRREAVVGVLGSGEFFGEECLAGHSIRKRHATAMTRSTVLVIEKAEMVRLLRTEPVLADRFMVHLLSRNVRVEDDLTDQLVSSCEQRLARTLLILAGHGYRGTRKKIVPRTSQTTLAEIVGSTRSRINGFLQKFKTLGFIEMDGSLTVRRSLLSVVSPCLRSGLRDRARNLPRSSVVPAGSHRTAADAATPKTVGQPLVKAASPGSTTDVEAHPSYGGTRGRRRRA
jgi:CRP/FNR family cyclic AMP-dependent transcriptional regulator